MNRRLVSAITMVLVLIVSIQLVIFYIIRWEPQHRYCIPMGVQKEEYGVVIYCDDNVDYIVFGASIVYEVKLFVSSNVEDTLLFRESGSNILDVIEPFIAMAILLRHQHSRNRIYLDIIGLDGHIVKEVIIYSCGPRTCYKTAYIKALSS